MARFKVPGRRGRPPRLKRKNNNDKKNERLEIPNDIDNETTENEVKPMVLSPDQYMSLFGNSDEEEEAEFDGFNDKQCKENNTSPSIEEPVCNINTQSTEHDVQSKEIVDVKEECRDVKDTIIQNEIIDPNICNNTSKRNANKVNYRASLGRRFSLTDDSNPYKKTYLSYGSRNRRVTLPLTPTNLRKKSPPKEIPLITRSKVSAKTNAAKTILSKAHKVKNQQNKTAISCVSSSSISTPESATSVTETPSTLVTPVTTVPAQVLPAVTAIAPAETPTIMPAEIITLGHNSQGKLPGQTLTVTSSLENPLKLSIKIEENRRTRRKQKSTFNSDFIYDISSRNLKRKYEEIKTPPPAEQLPVSNTDLPESPKEPVIKKEPKETEENPSQDIQIADSHSAKKKKPRIKNADSPKKKKTKIKMFSPKKNQQPSVAIKHELVMPQVVVKLEESTAETTRTDEKESEEKIDVIKEDIKNNYQIELPSIKVKEENTCLALPDGVDSKKQESRECRTARIKKTPVKLKDNVVPVEPNVVPREPASKSNAYLRLKVVKINGSLNFVDLRNKLVTFCKECENCRRKKDCGICGHCRSYCKTVRYLPCWERRCINPTFGKTVGIRKETPLSSDQNFLNVKIMKSELKAQKLKGIIGPKINMRIKNKREPSTTTKVQTPKKVNRKTTESQVKTLSSTVSREKSVAKKSPKKTPIKASEQEHEEVELTFISDSQLNKLSTVPEEALSEPLEFKVSIDKKKDPPKKDLTSPTGRSNVFTGLSPIKPKLRSTMSELMRKPTESLDMMLPKVYYGPETLVKLPWPNDGNEDAAWVSGHHLCFTSDVSFDMHLFCFLCGSGGYGKMITCQFCCEVFHPYCLDVEPVDSMRWSCDRCKRCTVCGFKENLLMCDKCHDCYHAECLGPFYQRDTEGVEETWVCGKCVKCTKCGRRTAGKTKTSRWMCNFSMCEDCGTNWSRKNYCPVCEVIYQEDDDSLKMMLCSRCERWIHMECEGITEDDYEILADLPDSIPYICKLCSGQDMSHSTWYKEVRDEMNSGLLKVYYDLISHRDFKQFKKILTSEQTLSGVMLIDCFLPFEEMFKKIENQTFKGVQEYFTHGLKALNEIKEEMERVNTFDITFGVYPTADDLLDFFRKSVKTIFPWHSPCEEKNEEDLDDDVTDCNNRKQQQQQQQQQQHLQQDFQPESMEIDVAASNLSEDTLSVSISESVKNEILSEDQHWEFGKQTNNPSDILDHCYSKQPKEGKEDAEKKKMLEFEPFELNRDKDVRKCLFCNKFGDSEEFKAGRLLFSGMDEWVHINCALWSAEVYEDDSGRLKHVYDAVKRGNKLKCESCGTWGASIGCCFLKCSRSYHFVCALESDVVFQDDKKIYCSVHAAKANKSLILTKKELSVPRRVIVDLVRFKSVKRIQRGMNPSSIKLVCGGFRLESLGSLSEKSDQKCALIPVGYRITKIFWSTTNPRRRCRYTCEIQVVKSEEDVSKSKVDISEQEKDLHNCTYCHDKQEWEKLLAKTECMCDVDALQSLGSVKRKLYPEPCTKCLENSKYCFSEDQNSIQPLLLQEPVKEIDKIREDHNFFPLDKKTEKTACKKEKPTKSKLKMRTENEHLTITSYSTASKTDDLRPPTPNSSNNDNSIHSNIVMDSCRDNSKNKLTDTEVVNSGCSDVIKTRDITSTSNVISNTNCVSTVSDARVGTTSTSIHREKYASFEQYELYRKILENPLHCRNNISKISPGSTSTVEITTAASKTSEVKINNNIALTSTPKAKKNLQAKPTVKYKKHGSSEVSVCSHKNSLTMKYQPTDKPVLSFSKSSQDPSSQSSKNISQPCYNAVLRQQQPQQQQQQQFQMPQQVQYQQFTTQTPISSSIKSYYTPHQCLSGISTGAHSTPVGSPSKQFKNMSSLAIGKLNARKKTEVPLSSTSCIKEKILIHASKLFNISSSGYNNSDHNRSMIPAVPKHSMTILPHVSKQLHNYLTNKSNNQIFNKLYPSSDVSNEMKLPVATTTFVSNAATSKLLLTSTSQLTPSSSHSQIESAPVMSSSSVTLSIIPNSCSLATAQINESLKALVTSTKKSPDKTVYKQILPKPTTNNQPVQLVAGYPILPVSSYQIVGLPTVHHSRQQLNSKHQLALMKPIPVNQVMPPGSSVYKAESNDIILPRKSEIPIQPSKMPTKYVITTVHQGMMTSMAVFSSPVLDKQNVVKTTTAMTCSVTLPQNNNKHQILLTQALPVVPNQRQPSDTSGDNQSILAINTTATATTTPKQNVNTASDDCLENLIASLTDKSPLIFDASANSAPAFTWSFKQEMLLRQLKEYLKKNPSVVNYVGNPKSQFGTIPIVNLTDSVQADNLVYYSAFLPEHLWGELVKSGIAQKDLDNVFQSKPGGANSNLNGFIQSAPANNTLLAGQHPKTCPLDIFNPNSSTVSLISSIKHLRDFRIQQQQQQHQQQQQKQQILRSSFPMTPSKVKSSFDETHTVLHNSMVVPITPNSKLLMAKELSCSSNMSPRKLLLKESMSQKNIEPACFSSIEAALLNPNNPMLTSHSSTSPYKTSSSSFQSPSPLKRKKRIKMASSPYESRNDITGTTETAQQHKTRTQATVSENHAGPIPSKRKHHGSNRGVVMDTEIDVCTFDMDIGCDEFIENNIHKALVIDEFLETNNNRKKATRKQNRKQKRDYAAMLSALLKEEEAKRKQYHETKLNFIISNDEGWKEEGSSLQEIWKKLIEKLNEVRCDYGMPCLSSDVNDAYDFLGLSREFVAYLVEQLPGGHKCRKYKFQHHLPCIGDDDQNLPENESGCARAEVVKQTAERDMFAWLSSTYRKPPDQCDELNTEDELLGGGQDLPTAMKYRFLKNTAKDHVGVYRSKIQGRGLFCKKTIETGDMIIEYSGEKIRSVLTDKREDYYEKKGYGCYMFRIDNMDVVDATMMGNAARFINHSCDPNCYSRIISVDGCKKIIIFAHRRITVGEELTYDYKFAQEDDKLPCYCGSKKCRKYLN